MGEERQVSSVSIIKERFLKPQAAEFVKMVTSEVDFNHNAVITITLVIPFSYILKGDSDDVVAEVEKELNNLNV